MNGRFYSIYSHGFIRAAVCIPALRVADPRFNLERTLELARRASAANVAVALFPELGLSAYSNDDLFQQDALLESVEAALERLRDESQSLSPVLLVGAPLQFDAKLFNCGVVLHRGEVPRGHSEELSAQLPRVLRKAPVHLGAPRPLP